MEMLIIGTGCMLGYMLNQNGKQNRNLTKQVIVSANNVPSGPLIYESNRLEEVDQYMRNLAAKKHADKVHQMFPLDYDQPNTIVPNDNRSGTPAQIVDLSSVDSSKAEFAASKIQAKATNVNVAAYDPATGRPYTSTVPSNVDDSPMFRPAQFASLAAEFAGPISLLTGQPLDMSHANMQPMFGKSINQPLVTNENPQVLLEKYTGIPSTDDQGTYGTRRELENALPSNPESPFTPNIYQMSDLYQRVSFGVKPSHEYQSPVKSFRDLPMKDTVQIKPPNIDQLRGPSRPQVTYSGVMIPGQKGSKRTMAPTSMKPNPWDMTSYVDWNDYVPNRSSTNASSVNVLPSVRNNNSTAEYENMYMAPPTNWRNVSDLSAIENSYRAQVDETVSRRIEAFSPGYGIAHGREKTPNNGVLMVKDPDKGYRNDRDGQPYQNIGPRWKNVSAPDTTVKETLAGLSTGAINLSGLKDNRAWKDAKVTANITYKTINAENKYMGQPHKDLGMGTRKQGIEPWVTMKETTEFSQTGNPTSLIPAHMSYDAVFDNDYNQEVKGDRYGVATAPNTKPVSDGGEIGPSVEKTMVTDYLTNPTGITQGRDRKQFVAGLNMDYQKLDFGGYFSGVKVGNGEDGKRSGMVQLKEEMEVPGRMNAPMKRDNPNDGRLDMEVHLKEETAENSERRTVQRTQPTEDILERVPVLTRTKNTESNNPRLDTGVKIRMTSDLYPWIKDKGTPEDTAVGERTL